MKTTAALFFLALFLSACDTNINSPDSPEEIKAYVPVYATTSLLNDVTIAPVRPTQKAGKIYTYGNYIFQNEMNEGIHIIDKSQAQPRKIAFLKIPYSTEIAVKGNYLYTNSVSDMLVIDITNPQQPTVVKRIKDAFPAIDQEHPPFSNVYFECVDPSKGIVVDWALKTIKRPNCRR
ncbi:hypothetical protein D3H65_20785 [Paraflavitalea soli]|uniref:LVIVD repeat-containing protein n=1 Tax=Paraflavitalea soli TaxID=2315862 RepID=A0A3B7MQ52_9BACT|nr:hypothetical protein [Paraflavitalea soli]AXY76278.1 hypothetical protein D3H65_20785 [Paraflavitalea soli]